MRPSVKAFRNRAAEKARQAASGGDGPPAGRAPVGPDDAPRPTTAERGSIRRRLRRARVIREERLRELGALVMEMHRQGRHDAGLVQRKAAEAAAADAEAQLLAHALDSGQTVAATTSAGIAGTCAACGGLLWRDDRFCARCGTPAASSPNGAPAIAAPPPAGEPVQPGPAFPPPSGQPVEPSSAPTTDMPPPTGEPVEAPTAAFPPPTGEPVEPAPSGR